MSIYVKFSAEGHSIEMTNVNPNSTEYVELGDDMMGKHLIKENDSVREMTEAETEDKLKAVATAAMAVSVNNQAEHLLKESEALALPDAWEKYTADQKKEVSTYRDFLRTIKNQKGYPLEITWPEIPVIEG